MELFFGLFFGLLTSFMIKLLYFKWNCFNTINITIITILFLCGYIFIFPLISFYSLTMQYDKEIYDIMIIITLIFSIIGRFFWDVIFCYCEYKWNKFISKLGAIPVINNYDDY